ncbi:Spore coat protein coth [Globisporangium polare]
MRVALAVVAALATALLHGASAQPVTAPPAAPVTEAPYDKTCFELPIVIVSPTKERLPTPVCNQQRYPAIDCRKTAVEADIEVIDNNNGTLNCLNGPRTAVYSAKTHYRGQSSLGFSKHQLSVNLHEDGALLGFPADKKFVLNGPVIDSSLMRNHLAQWLFRQTDRYSPRSRHIVVFIRDKLDTNDNSPAYKGIYLGLEKISYGPNRVGLAPLDNTCKESELNGGWAWQNNPLNYGVYSPNIVRDKYQIMFGSGERPVLMHPSARVLTQSMRDYFVDPSTGPLPRMYEYLYENMTNTRGFEETLDIGSFVDYFLHSEMSQNSDAYRRSAYFFKDRDQPINAGPVWDFNLAYGKGANQKDWLYKPHTFWKRLLCNYKFASLVPKRWRELRAGAWSDETIADFLGNASAPISRQLEHCGTWTSINLQCANTNPNGGTFLANVDSLERTVLARARWMDEHVAGFYMKLNSTVCEPAGPIPKYNCAEDGDDDGCLSDPEKYIKAVEFPAIRKPSSDKQCAAKAAASGGTSNEALEEPTIDPCWLAAGVYITEGSLTPFCSGYGSCPPGPGAKCTCIQSRKLPTCARSDDPIAIPDLMVASQAEVAQVAATQGSAAENNGSSMKTEVLTISGCMLAAMCGLFVFLRNRREKKRNAALYPPVLGDSNEKGSPLQYGTS